MPGQCCTGDNEPCSAQVFIRLAAELCCCRNDIFRQWVEIASAWCIYSSLTVSMQWKRISSKSQQCNSYCNQALQGKRAAFTCLSVWLWFIKWKFSYGSGNSFWRSHNDLQHLWCLVTWSSTWWTEPSALRQPEVWRTPSTSCTLLSYVFLMTALNAVTL